jgi:hypothetical protein
VFIQTIQGKCSNPDQLRKQLDTWRDQFGESAPGWLGGTYGFTDDETFIGVVRFESREAAAANSGRAEQSAWWAETETCFDGPVEFHDCDNVRLMLDGGSDEAGFVQVVRGRVDDSVGLEADLDKMARVLHELRPEIIGATLAIDEDGTFTQTVAFTDEASARAGEAHEMPLSDDVREMWQEWDRLTKDVSYYDLHQPWFASRGATVGR